MPALNDICVWMPGYKQINTRTNYFMGPLGEKGDLLTVRNRWTRANSWSSYCRGWELIISLTKWMSWCHPHWKTKTGSLKDDGATQYIICMQVCLNYIRHHHVERKHYSLFVACCSLLPNIFMCIMAHA